MSIEDSLANIAGVLDTISVTLKQIAKIPPPVSNGPPTAPPAAATASAKPRGRPAGSVNKPKDAEPTPVADSPMPTAAPAELVEDVGGVPNVTIAQTAVTDAIKVGGRDAVIKVLGKYGAKSASFVKEADRAAFIEEVQAIIEAAEMAS